MIQHELSREIMKPIGEVFDFIDDTSKAPLWLESCVEITQVSKEPKSTGTKLHYVYYQGGRNREMDGIITEYTRGNLLTMKFSDSQFEVQIGFRLTPIPGGTLVAHSIAIASKGIFGKMMTRIIGAGNQKQIQSNLARLQDQLAKSI